MPVQRRKRHSEERWKLLPEHIVRCQGHNPNGKRCGFEAEAGSVVCERHGGGAPQVRRRAAERVIMTADHAAEMLVKWLDDPSVPFGDRIKIAQNLMDRAGLIAAQVHQIIPSTVDPVTRFFEGLDPQDLATLGPDGRHYTQDELLAKAFSNSATAIESGQSDGELPPMGYAARDHFPIPDAESEILDAELVEDAEPKPESVNGDAAHQADDRRRRVQPAGSDMSRAVNPECRAGKHRNCDGKAMCDLIHWILCDQIHDCGCECHQSTSAPNTTAAQ